MKPLCTCEVFDDHSVSSIKYIIQDLVDSICLEQRNTLKMYIYIYIWSKKDTEQHSKCKRTPGCTTPPTFRDSNGVNG